MAKVINLSNLTVSDLNNGSKYTITQIGQPKEYHLPMDEHAPLCTPVITDANKYEFICNHMLDER